MTTVVRWTVLGALFTIPFIPLYIANGLYFPFITGKHFVFRILVEVLVVGWGLLALMDARYRPKFSWLLVLFGGLVAWMFVADLFAVNPHKAFWSNYERMDGWVTLAHMFGLFLAGGAVLSAEGLWRKWWHTFAGASAFVCAYGLMQVAGFFEIHQGGVRLDATMGNAAYLASYLLFSIGVSVWLALTAATKMRYAFAALALVQTYLLFLTATRGALLGFAVALVVGMGAYMLRAQGRMRAIGVGVLAGFALLAGLLFLARDTEWVRSEPTLARLSSITLADGATRFALWGMAAQGVAERPLLGWGHEGFNYIFNEHYSPALYAQEPWFDRAHNIYVDWMVAGGIPAFLLFAGMLGYGAYLLLRRENRVERIVLSSVLLAYAVQGFFVFDNLFAYVPLAMLLAMAHAGAARPITRLEKVPVYTSHGFQTVAVPVGAVVAIVLVWSVNVPSMLAGNDLIQGLMPWPDARTNLAAFERALSRGGFASQEIREQWVAHAASVTAAPTVPADVKMLFAKRAVEEIAKEVEHTPRDARLRLQYAYALRTFGDYEGALRQLKEAQSLSPQKQSLLLEEGILHWQKGEHAAARAAFRAAYELSPQFEELALYAAAGDIVSGNAESGRALLLERFGTTTINHNVLILAYYDSKDYANLFASLRKRISDTPNDPSAYFQLASTYAQTGRLEEGRAVLREALTLFPSLAPQITQALTTLGQQAP